MKMARAKQVLILLVAAAMLAGLLVYSHKVSRQLPGTSDFDTYFKIANRADNGTWIHVYSLELDGRGPFRYMPITLPLFQVLSWFPYGQARMVWFWLQALCFLAGFLVIRMALKGRVPKQGVDVIVLLGAAMVFRFVMDSLYAGQVLGMMFLGFSLSFWGWMAKRPVLACVGLAIPAALKLGPALLFGLFWMQADPRDRRRILLGFLPVLAFWVAGCALWMGHEFWGPLWKGWIEVIAKSEEYVEFYFHKNQSVLAALERLGIYLHWPREYARILHRVLSVAGISLVLIYWWNRKNTHDWRNRAALFSLGILSYLWWMPETNRHTYSFMSFPYLLLLEGCTRAPASWSARALLLMVFAVHVLSGAELIGAEGNRWLGQWSLPLCVSFLLGGYMWRLGQAVRTAIPGSRASG